MSLYKTPQDGSLHPFEAHLVALQTNLKAQVEQKAIQPGQASYLSNELDVLRQDMASLRQHHGGCVSAVPGEVCEHCLSVVKVRLHMLLERDRRARRLQP